MNVYRDKSVAGSMNDMCGKGGKNVSWRIIDTGTFWEGGTSVVESIIDVCEKR